MKTKTRIKAGTVDEDGFIVDPGRWDPPPPPPKKTASLAR
jgi:hypothetical protein